MAEGKQDDEVGARVFAALFLFVMCGGGFWWVDNLLTCETPAGTPVAKAPGQRICEKLIGCELKAVDLATCMEWTRGPRCDAASLAAIDNMARMLTCKSMLASDDPLRDHNGCVHW